MKKILLLTIALFTLSGVWAAKTVYLEPNIWNYNAYAVYAWGGSNGADWYNLLPVEGTSYYKAEIPDDRTGMLFTCGDDATKAKDWDQKARQTEDVTTITDGTAYVITSKDGGAEGKSVVTSTTSSYSVRFATDRAWTNIYAYAWKSGEDLKLGEWPGKKMAATAETFNYDGVAKTIYSLSFFATTEPVGIIFNNGEGGDGKQTADLTFTNNKFYVSPPTNPTDPTDPAARVIAIFSNYYEKALTESNNGWGGGPNPKYTSITFPVIQSGHTVVDVMGTAVNGRASGMLNAEYNTLHVALWPTTATSCKIWDDNKYSSATVYDGLVPGQWNYVEVSDVAFTTNYIGIELYNGETPETEFYLDHFYFSKPSSGDTTPPTFDKHVLKSANCVGATLTLQATDNNGGEITYKITDTASSTVYQTTAASGTEIDFVVAPLEPSSDYTFSVIAIDANGNETSAETINATTTAMPNIPALATADSYYKLWDGNDGGAKNGFFFADWGGGTGSSKEINGKPGYLVSNFKWFGSQFTKFDASGMTYLQLDVLPTESGNLSIVPINTNVGAEGNQPEKGTQFSVTAGEWNSLRIPIADVIENDGVTMSEFFQIKFVGSVEKHAKGTADGFVNGSGTMCFYVGNVYLYTTSAPSTEVTVSFKNSIGWDKVYAYVADAEWNAISEEWPGDEITSTLSWSTTSDNAKWVIFNNGEVQTANLEFTNGTEYDYGYYVVGNMNGWAKTDGYAMSRNTYCTSNVEYKLARQALTTTNQFKVALWNGKELNTYYPDGMGNSYGENGEITADGTYNIFFRPNADGGDDWHYNYIWAGIVGDLEDLGTDSTTGAQVLDGTWNAEEFATLDSNVKASSYDLTNVTGISSTLDVAGKTVNPYCMFITSAPGKVNRNEVVWDEANSRYNGFAMFFAEPADATAPFDINTSIAPIHVTNPFFQRLFTSANNYFTMTIPFDYILPATDKAWTMSATSSESGLSVTFTEVAAGSTLTKNTPYLYFSSVGGVTMPDPGEVIIDWAAQTVDETDASFVANYSRKVTDGTENIYVLPGVVQEADLVFQKAGEVSIRPFRAYLQAASAPAKINVMFDDATGIHAATAEQLEGIFNIYSIDGKLVRQNGDKMGLNKGVYIINGKKVVVK